MKQLSEQGGEPVNITDMPGLNGASGKYAGKTGKLYHIELENGMSVNLERGQFKVNGTKLRLAGPMVETTSQSVVPTILGDTDLVKCIPSDIYSFMAGPDHNLYFIRAENDKVAYEKCAQALEQEGCNAEGILVGHRIHIWEWTNGSEPTRLKDMGFHSEMSND